MTENTGAPTWGDDEVTSNGNGANAPDATFEGLLKEVKKLGGEAALGKDSLPKLALRVIKASADGLFAEANEAAKQAGKGAKDAITTVYEKYVEGESKKTIHDHTAGGKKANVSKLRQLEKFGGMVTCDPVEVAYRTLRLRKEMADSEIKVKGTYPALVDVARKQLSQDSELSDDQIRETVRKPDAPDKQVLDELKRAEAILKRLITGESKAGMDQHDETIAAHDALTRRLSALMVVDDAQLSQAA